MISKSGAERLREERRQVVEVTQGVVVGLVRAGALVGRMVTIFGEKHNKQVSLC